MKCWWHQWEKRIYLHPEFAIIGKIAPIRICMKCDKIQRKGDYSGAWYDISSSALGEIVEYNKKNKHLYEQHFAIRAKNEQDEEKKRVEKAKLGIQEIERIRADSSASRAPAWHAGGRECESPSVHQRLASFANKLGIDKFDW